MPLHYKTERFVTLELFLITCQRMYTIFEDKNKPMDEQAKIKFLLKAIQGYSLFPSVKAFKIRIATSVTAVTYATV